MSAIKPHRLHATLSAEGFWDDVRLDCPYDADDPTKPCAMVDIYNDHAPIPGCAGIDWLEALGMEILSGSIANPSFPLEVDVTWHNGGDHLTLDIREPATITEVEQ